METFLRVSVLSKFPKKWESGVIFHEEFENHGVMLPKSKHPILVGILTKIAWRTVFNETDLDESRKMKQIERLTERLTESKRERELGSDFFEFYHEDRYATFYNEKVVPDTAGRG